MIVIDSNQLIQAQPGSPVWLLLKAVGEQTGHSLAISDVSLWEATNKARELIAADSQAASKALQKLNGRLRSYEVRADVPTVAEVDISNSRIDAVIRRYEFRLREAFQVLTTPPDAAVEALRREALKLPPCKPNGEGGRDTSIWLTALRAATNEQADTGTALPLIFVSRDKGFTDPADVERLHPALRDDLPDGLDVVFCRSLPAAFAEVSDPAEPSSLVIDTSSREVSDRIITAVVEGALPGVPEAVSAGHREGNSQVFTMGDLLRSASVLFEGFNEPPIASKKPGQTVVVGTGSWRFLPPAEDAEPSTDARLTRGRRYAFGERIGRSLCVTATLVWTVDPNGGLGDFQVAQVSSHAYFIGPATRVTAHDDGSISTTPVTLGPDGVWGTTC
ncbi:PIN domain-containing protein [Streptomyces sp. SAS_272]|uniref:PIN domain-containing protein n=1 Tax=Streptomyces sp. SAS_272 TaxID=3412747 RepID=UPI00403C7020